MQSESPEKPAVMRWLTKMPDGLSLILLVGAIGSALAVHDRVQDLEHEVSALRDDVEVIKRAVVGTYATR
jgi:hypothetical protein